MLKNISIKKFKCFDFLTVDETAQINLITGRNNVGKSSLLEALFLICGGGNASNVMKLAGFRGFGEFRFNQAQPLSTLKVIEEFFLTPIFYQNNEDDHIVISASFADKYYRLEMFLTKSDRVSLSIGNKGGVEDVTLPLKYQFKVGNEEAIEYTLQMSEDQPNVSVEPNPGMMPFPGHFLTPRHYSGQGEDADILSGMISSGEIKKHDIASYLTSIEENIVELIALPKLGVPMIYCNISDRLMRPLVYMGDGTRRLVSMLLRIPEASGGVLFVDEIDSGFHYSYFVKLWQSLNKYSIDSNTQIFATTHSAECLQAAYSVFGGKDDNSDFMVHRLTKKNNQVKIKSFTDEKLDNAMEFGFDLRG